MAKYLWVGGGGRGTERSLKSEEVIPDLLFMPIERERERSKGIERSVDIYRACRLAQSSSDEG